MRLARTPWFMPLFSLLLGVAMFAAQWYGGHRQTAFWSLGIMAAFDALLAFGGRSETIRGLRGDGSDERVRRIDLAATAFAGTAVIVAIIAAFLVEVARGRSGMPYAWLGAVGGVAYVGAVVALRIRG